MGIAGVIENFDPRNPDLIKEPTEKQNGTVWYMPPEQGNHPKVDVWALGVILGIPPTYTNASILTLLPWSSGAFVSIRDCERTIQLV